jgi:hypothetical protein
VWRAPAAAVDRPLAWSQKQTVTFSSIGCSSLYDVYDAMVVLVPVCAQKRNTTANFEAHVSYVSARRADGFPAIPFAQ